MKRCPECGREYDNTMMFCLDDGAELLYGPASMDEPATAILPSLSAPGEAATRAQVSGTDQTAVLRSDTEAKPQESLGGISRRMAKPLAMLIAAALILAGGFFGYRYLSSANSKQIESIAVMPFINESGNSDVEYLSDGMTETLINTLNQLPNLNVKARSSVFRYKGKNADAATVGTELNVQAVLFGRVVQRGDALTIYLELVDAKTGNSIWGDQYNRKQGDLVSLQNEIARDVTGKLKTRLSRTDEQKLAANYTANPEAYQLYLQGRYHWNKQNNKDVDTSIEYFRKAIEIDPNYALAYAGLADAYSLNVIGSNRDRMAKARGAATRAISLDENLAEAHASLCRILAVDDYDFPGAEREVRRAIDLNPNYGIAHHFYADILSTMARHEEGFAEHRRALELEPFSLTFNTSYGRALSNARRFDEAIAQFKKTLEMDPNFAPARMNLSQAYEITARYRESIDERAKYQEVIGDNELANKTRAVFATGGWQGYLRYLTSEERPQNLSNYHLAVAYTGLGEKEKAFQALNTSYEDHEITLLQLVKNDPRLDPLRDDPRFQELLKRVGLFA